VVRRVERGWQKRLTVEMQRDAFATVPYIPIGNYFLQAAYRSTLTGICAQPRAAVLNVRRA
jgi:hypothetical protein